MLWESAVLKSRLEDHLLDKSRDRWWGQRNDDDASMSDAPTGVRETTDAADGVSAEEPNFQNWQNAIASIQ